MIYVLSILLFIMCCVAAGLWVWAGGVHSDYLEAKLEAEYYFDQWQRDSYEVLIKEPDVS
jgi:hypothetical protein